jgi:hypothetical protein
MRPLSGKDIVDSNRNSEVLKIAQMLIVLNVFTLIFVFFLATYAGNTLLPLNINYDPLNLPSQINPLQIFPTLTNVMKIFSSQGLFFTFVWIAYCSSISLIVKILNRFHKTNLTVFVLFFGEITVLQSILTGAYFNHLLNNLFSLMVSIILYALNSELIYRPVKFLLEKHYFYRIATTFFLIFAPFIVFFFFQSVSLNWSSQGVSLAQIVVYFFWGIFIFLPIGLYFWGSIFDANEIRLLDIFLIALFGIVFVSGLTWIFLEISIFLKFYTSVGWINVLSPLIFVAINCIVVYYLKRHLKKIQILTLLKRFGMVLFHEIGPLLAIFVFLVILTYPYYFAPPLHGLPWFDIWQFWGPGYVGASGNLINIRFSFFFPGQFSLFNSAFLASIFSIIPTKETSIVFMRYIPLLVTYFQGIGVYAIARELTKRSNLVKQSVEKVIVGLLSAIAFLSTTWTMFYSAIFARESIGILLVIGIIGLTIFFTKAKNPLRILLLILFLSIMTIYVSPIQTLILPPILILVIFCLVRIKSFLEIRKKAILSLLIVALISIAPFLLSEGVISWRINNGIIGEPMPGLSIFNYNSSQIDNIASQTSLFTPFSSIVMQKYSIYLIGASIGFFSFLISILGLIVFFGLRRSNQLFFVLIVVYAVEIFSYFIWGQLFPSTSSDMRRFVFSASLLLSLSFALGSVKITHFFKRFSKNHDLKKILLIILTLQMIFGIMLFPSINRDSPTTSTELLLQLDKNLPRDGAVVLDSPFVSQALLLSPRYTITGGDFARVFAGVSSNQTKFDSMIKYMTSNRVTLVISTGTGSSLSEILASVLKNNLSVTTNSSQVFYDLATAKWNRVYITTPILSLRNTTVKVIDDFSNKLETNISSVDSIQNWLSEPKVQIDQLDTIGTTGSIKASSSHDFGMTYVPPVSLNVSKYDYFIFWAKSNSSQQAFQLYLRDGQNQRWYDMQFLKSNTWEKFVIQLSNFNGQTNDLNLNHITQLEFWLQFVKSNITFKVDGLQLLYLGWGGPENIPFWNLNNGVGQFWVSTSGKDQWWTVDKSCGVNSSEYNFLTIRTSISSPSIPIYIELRDELNKKYDAFFFNTQTPNAYALLEMPIPSNMSITKIRIGFHSLSNTPPGNYSLNISFVALTK